MFQFFKKKHGATNENPPLNSENEKKSASTVENEKAPPKTWRERLFSGLKKTRDQWGAQIHHVFKRGQWSAELAEELEELLLSSDVGIDATTLLLNTLKEKVKREKLEGEAALQNALKEVLTELLRPLEQPLNVDSAKPFVIMLAGVNGAGKTTSIGKLAKYYQAQNKKVLLAAGDTFRAAAREQLAQWGKKNEVTVVMQDSADPAAVIFDAISAARARDIDVVLADTAGRLPSQGHLMEEIAKVKRVIQKTLPEGPHETLLVLDAHIGQNALQQVQAFDHMLNVTGLIITKLDGTAKGGVLAAIATRCPKPVRFIGVGEGIDDLRPFVAQDFVEAILAEDSLKNA